MTLGLQAQSDGSRMRDLQRTLALAADAKIAEVVSLVDAMTERGAADALLAPLRSRLQVLGVRRPLALSRLLFIPADPVIVPGGQWRRNTPGIPRSALACLSAQIRRAMGSDAVRLDRELEGATCDNAARIAQHGAHVWPIAGAILHNEKIPDDWNASTGLNAADHAAITAPLSALLRQATAIDELVIIGARFGGLPASSIKDCLATTADGHGGARIGMLVAVLLARLPDCAQVITVAGDLAAARSDPAARQAVDLAIGFALGNRAHDQASPDVREAAVGLSRLADLLDALDRPGPTFRPTSRAQVATIRQETDETCRARFERTIAPSLLASAGAARDDLSDAAVAAAEALARDLRRFEAAARRFGSPTVYDRMLKQTSVMLVEVTAPADGWIELARLVEILQGPETALQVLASPSA